MNNPLLITASVALISLYILSEISGQVFKIRKFKFYRIFHFTGGALTFFFFFVLTDSRLISIILTETVGIAWEIYEWVAWKYSLRKNMVRPPRKDTIEDLFLDLAGGILALAFTYIG